LASEFLENVKPQGVLEKVRPSDGAIVRYNPKTEEFGILDKSGTVKTYYKPQPGKHPYKTNMEYYDAQR
jgi:filamentous hemagglutinin